MTPDRLATLLRADGHQVETKKLNDGGTLLKFTHRAIGLIEPGLEENVSKGWEEMLGHIRTAAEKRRG